MRPLRLHDRGIILSEQNTSVLVNDSKSKAVNKSIKQMVNSIKMMLKDLENELLLLLFLPLSQTLHS